MANDVIKKCLKDNNVTRWQLGDLLNVSEATICRKLRHELSPEETNQIISIIENFRS